MIVIEEKCSYEGMISSVIKSGKENTHLDFDKSQGY